MAEEATGGDKGYGKHNYMNSPETRVFLFRFAIFQLERANGKN
jgi:hypothetical protein